MYGQTYHCWKKKGHGVVDLRSAIIQSCDTYFYEMSRRLGVDRLKVTASRFGLGNKVFQNLYMEEKGGLFPSTNWKKANLLMGNNTDDFQIFISVDKIKNWVKALNKLNSLPGIKKITTQKLTNEGAFVTVTVEGGLNRFISIVFENKLPFSGPKEKLILNSDKL